MPRSPSACSSPNSPTPSTPPRSSTSWTSPVRRRQPPRPRLPRTLEKHPDRCWSQFLFRTSRPRWGRRLPRMTTRPCEQIVAGTAGASGLIFEAIPQAKLRGIKAAGVDEAGNQLTVQVDTEGGSPLRCCLRESDPGERMLLIAYTPPGTRGAYAERGLLQLRCPARSAHQQRGRPGFVTNSARRSLRPWSMNAVSTGLAPPPAK